MDLVDSARKYARQAHQGQTDLTGGAYFDTHLAPIAAIAQVFNSPEITAGAWLHDVIEDTSHTAADLLDAGFPPPVVQGVVSVTEQKEPKEPYTELIIRAAQDPIGKYVKLADNAWNIACNSFLAKSNPEKAQQLMDAKYLPARDVLRSACQVTPEQITQMEQVANTYLEKLGRNG